MELSQLSAFVTVANERNLTRASALLFLTPPSVSARIKTLEDELGIKLFIRTNKGMELSNEGRQLKDQAELLLQQARCFSDNAKNLQDSVGGKLRIGLNTSPSLLQASPLVAQLQQNYPQLEVSLQPSVSTTICERVLAGTLDAGFAYGRIDHSALSVVHIQTTSVIVIAPQQWQNKLKDLSPPQLAQQPWIWVSTICPYVHLLEQLFATDGQPDNIAASADDEQATVDLVKAGVGLGIVDEKLAATDLENGSIIRLETEKFEIALSLVYQTGRQQDPLINILRQTLKTLWSEMRPETGLEMRP